ncbi:dihydrofolate reductase [Lactobacillus sp. ESL0785]|uniref:dihydrofolate reductase n=1 Tax=Lactobacillus sp. ESL0785 TaxID=2983232 RepID=UPI0023F88F50|nr:dihydrofolate reductase [Lactobacillus sp. ESL0785]WEV70252.1 dihydrofolate reductase [Lactobacillus sp. ESL0785]
MITFVWVEDQKKQIGLNGHLPWKLPGDLQHFRKLTSGHTIVMGRKTFTSLPKILPHRKHIVLSKNHELAQKYSKNQQVVILSSLKQLELWLANHQEQQIDVIGGNAVFKPLVHQVDRLEKTVIAATFKGDTIMTPIDYSKFKLVKKEYHNPNLQDKYPYEFLTYIRKEETK